MDTPETWAQHPEFRSYWVSNLGRVMIGERRGRWLGRVLAGRVNEGGYRRIGLYENGQRFDRYVHVLVLEAHIGPRPGSHREFQALHWNGKPLDNRIENLRWGTVSENYDDQREHGTAAVGERHGRSQLTDCEREKILRSHEHRDVLAKRYGVTPNLIRKLRARHS
jgi:hypothetical protein